MVHCWFYGCNVDGDVWVVDGGGGEVGCHEVELVMFVLEIVGGVALLVGLDCFQGEDVFVDAWCRCGLGYVEVLFVMVFDLWADFEL